MPIRRFIVVFLIIAAALGAVFVYRTYESERQIAASAILGLRTFQAGIEDAQALQFGDAEAKFLAIGSSAPPFPSAVGGPIRSFDDAIRALRETFGNAGGVYRDFRELSLRAASILGALQKLQISWPTYVFQGDKNSDLIPTLRGLRDDLGSASELGNRLAGYGRVFGGFVPADPDEYLALQAEVGRAKRLLDVLVPWLESDTDRHLVVFFSNSAEMRPAGGFLGSYAEVTLRHGSVSDITVRDINESDRLFMKNIVPPKPLQALVRRWRAADANWFADFPISAAKTIEFMEASELYASSGVRFDGAFAASPQVIEDLLDAGGPLVLPKAKVTLTSKNFLAVIQEEVQAAQAANASNPKRILSEAAPELIERISGNAVDSAKLFDLLRAWTEKKDLLVFFREPEFQAFASAYGASGETFVPATTWNGDYLAVVNANVGGGKSDRFVKETVTVQSQVGGDGVVTNHVELARAHEGKGEAWWYAVRNESYLKLFAPLGTRLQGVSGVWQRTVVPKVKYEKEGYAIDPTVQAIEATAAEVPGQPGVTAFRESGKVAFAAWTRVSPGATTTVVFDYMHRLLDPPAPDRTYEVVIDKQHGTSRRYRLQISAPVGFRWRENGLAVFEKDYEADDMPGQIKIMLTFERAT